MKTKYIKYLKEEDYYPCRVCKGSGNYEMTGDLHRSPGIVPCSNCSRGTVKHYVSENREGYDYDGSEQEYMQR